MKRLVYIVLILTFLAIITSCATKTVYVPIENTKVEKEYVDRWLKDSIYLHDSIVMKSNGDTIWLEKYKTLYKEKLVRDSIFVTDSIKVDVPYLVEVPKPCYPKWLVILGCIGVIPIAFLGYRIFMIFR